MGEYTNPTSNISYTAKDFQTIYPDLLNLTKELSSRWDPSIANESDPGVILLKLNAIIGDKLNYNIDKNVLETFPRSITQASSARKLYSALGYRMRWYRSAHTTVMLRWKGERYSSESITIPQFTMVTNHDKTMVYTLIGLSDNIKDNNNPTVSDIKISMDGKDTSCYALQGTAINYNMNGETVIRTSDLDAENRIYFDTADIAENGVFIANTGDEKVYDWQRVDNILSKELDKKYFEFGVTDDGYSCYVQFPEDAENIIKDGIEIVYIRTVGEDGNVAPQELERFYGDLLLETSDGTEVTLDEDSVVISNDVRSLGGMEPESIRDAYENYIRTVGIFDTLITLRDYTNAIQRSGLVSNCFVCDKTNDVQCSYYINSLINGLQSSILQMEHAPNVLTTYDKYGRICDTYAPGVEIQIYDRSGREIQAYDRYGNEIRTFAEGEKINVYDQGNGNITSLNIKLYTLSTVPYLDDDTFQKTFQLQYADEEHPADILAYLAEKKHIGHLYSKILPTSTEYARPCLFKNVYDILATVYTKLEIGDDNRRGELVNNIKKSLYENLNSSQLKFGKQVSLDSIKKIIEDSDSYIKSVSVDGISDKSYNTYAVYYDGNQMKEVLISTDDYVDKNFSYSCDDWDPNRAYEVGDIAQLGGVRKKCLMRHAGWNQLNGWIEDNYIVNIDYETFAGKIGRLNYNTFTFTYIIPVETGGEPYWALDNEGSYTKIELSDYGIEIVSGTKQHGDSLLLNISKSTQIRDEVYTKSILRGKTPLYQADEDIMDYRVGTQLVETRQNIWKIDGTYKIDVSKVNPVTNYTIRENEMLQFFSPNLKDDIKYSNYVKFEVLLNPARGQIKGNDSIQLQANEFIIFYYKQTGNEDGLYQYHAYGEGSIISPSFIIQTNAQIAQPGAKILPSYDKWATIEVNGISRLEASSEMNGPMKLEESYLVEEDLTTTSHVLNGTRSISLKKVDQQRVDNLCYCYWILNQSQNGRYVLFGPDDYEYILGNGEYFIYSDANLANMTIYGEGTIVSRNQFDISGEVAVSSDISYIELMEYGMQALASLENGLYQPIVDKPIILISNKYISLGSGCTIEFNKNADAQFSDNDNTFSITRDGGVANELKNYTIRYTDQSGTVSTLPEIAIQSGGQYFGWDAKTLFKLQFNASKGQILHSNQTVTCWTYDDEEQIVYSVEDPANDPARITVTAYNKSGKTESQQYTYYRYDTILYSNFDIYSSGIKEQFIYQIDPDTGMVKYANITRGQFCSNTSSPAVFNPLTTGGVQATIYPTDSSGNIMTVALIPFRSIAGDYMCSLSSSQEEIRNFQISLLDENYNPVVDSEGKECYFTPIYDTSVTKVASLKDVSMRFTIPNVINSSTGEQKYENKPLFIKIKIETVTGGALRNAANIWITNPQKFTYSKAVSDFRIAKYEELLGKLDPEHVFDYTYTIPENELIKDPLDPKSFLNENHPFNPYTICQYSCNTDLIEIRSGE